LCQKSTGQEVCTGTGFDPDQARWHVHCVHQQLLAAETLLDDDVAFLAQTNQMEYRLADVNAENVYFHG